MAAQATVSLVRKSVSATNLWGSGASPSASAPGSAAFAAAGDAGSAASSASQRAPSAVRVPLVLWERPPHVAASCVHAAFLPRSQPSQNSNGVGVNISGAAARTRRASSTNSSSTTSSSGRSKVAGQRIGRRSVGAIGFHGLEDEGEEVEEEDFYLQGDASGNQLGVFVGTVDGVVLYWLFENDEVVQVNMLVFADPEGQKGGDGVLQVGAAVQGIVTGVDEWGQSTLVSIARDGAVARWQLPNGVCSGASASLAKEIAPVKGLEMCCNNRYAVAFSDESRMMVLDTWRMVLLYCVDTAQEQIRRSIAVAELKNVANRASTGTGATAAIFQKSSNAGFPSSNTSTSSRSQQLHGASTINQDSSVSGADTDQSLSSPIGNRVLHNSMLPSSSPHTHRSSPPARLVWDSLVISLGTEGLIKCFLWAKPPGSNTVGTSASHWMQQSCWILSWADDTQDITCSQSTSLKDGDNMNPQTALMRSIKTSYFPVTIQLSANASFVLCIWKTKWIVVKRKWLCDIETTGYSGSDKSKTKARGASCRKSPAQLVRDLGDDSFDKLKQPISWEDGQFLTDTQIVLWTTSGHVFTFQIGSGSTGGHSTSQDGGKFFIFTKDYDQLVPRSSCKNLLQVTNFQCVGVMNKCKCCQQSTCDDKARGFQVSNQLHEQVQRSGFTSCVMPTLSSSTKSSYQSLTIPRADAPKFNLVHTCGRGCVAFWSIPISSSIPPAKALLKPEEVTESPRYFYLNDGFYPQGVNIKVGQNDGGHFQRGKRQLCLSHLIIPRDTAGSSSMYEIALRAGVRRKRRQTHNDQHDASNLTNSSTPASVAAAVLANALGPMVGRSSSVTPSSIDSVPSKIGLQAGTTDKFLRHLLDVPLIAKGYSDGSITYQLLGARKEELGESINIANNDSAVTAAASLHRGKVTALAHCYWPHGQTKATALPHLVTSALRRASATGRSSRPGAQIEGNPRKSIPALTRRGSFSQASSFLASDKNPFYRSRFPPSSASMATARRTSSSRQLNALTIDTTVSAAPTAFSAPSSPRAGIAPGQNGQILEGIAIFLFSGGQDGVLKVTELTLTQAQEDGTFTCENTVIQQFRNHRGRIEQISISALRCTNDDYDQFYPDRFVGTVGSDRKLVVYGPMYSQNPSNSGSIANSSGGRAGVEFECLFEFSQHTDAIYDIEWHLDRGLVHVECADQMVYVWSTNTGILERVAPSGLIHGGGNASLAGGDGDGVSTDQLVDSSVECSNLPLGDMFVHVLRFKILQCAESIKSNWRNYFEVYGEADDTDRNDTRPDETRTLQSASRSPYAIGSIELLLLSFLLSWGASPEIDQACRTLLGIDRPTVRHSFALEAVAGATTVPLPWKSAIVGEPGASKDLDFVRHWQHSSAMSANLALAVVSLAMNLMEHRYTKATKDFSGRSPQILPTSPRNKEEFQVLWSQIITQHSVVLPDYVPNFREPSLESLAKFGFDSCEYTQLAARTLLNGIIKRLSPASRSSISAEYAAKLHFELARLETETGSKVSGGGGSIDSGIVVDRLGPLVILLSMIGTCYPGEIAPASAREVCDILVHLLKSPAHFVAFVAAELLTKGLMLFRPHLLDLSSLVCQLLLLDMREKLRDAAATGDDSSGPNHDARVLASGGSNAALSLLVELGACESAFVLTLLQQEMNSNDRPQGYRECVLLFLTELINTHYLLMFRHLPAVVDTIMCGLDPTKPDRRKRCLPLSTRCLQNLVRRFPMVDFHRDTQRLAVGTMEAVILIYDLRTATKWRVLDGHASAVSAVSFRVDGQILVSYAAREGSVRWWNSGNAGLFGGMLKMHQSCLKEHKLDVLTVGSAPASSGGASADLKQVIQTCRFHFLSVKVSTDSPSPSGADAKSKQILRLTREDASQVQFLL